MKKKLPCLYNKCFLLSRFAWIKYASINFITAFIEQIWTSTKYFLILSFIFLLFNGFCFFLLYVANIVSLPSVSFIFVLITWNISSIFGLSSSLRNISSFNPQLTVSYGYFSSILGSFSSFSTMYRIENTLKSSSAKIIFLRSLCYSGISSLVLWTVWYSSFISSISKKVFSRSNFETNNCGKLGCGYQNLLQC